MNFIKRIRRNPARPVGVDTVTVVEFSLTDDARVKLERALEPYVSGKETDLSKLGNIFLNKDNFPAPILEELKNLSEEGKAASTVYVVKNLPELKTKDILNLSPSDCTLSTYANFIALGIGQAIKMERVGGSHYLERLPKAEIQGQHLHKHRQFLSALSGLYLRKNKGFQPATRFTNIRTLLQDPIFPQVHNNSVSLVRLPGKGERIRNERDFLKQVMEPECPQEIELWIDGNHPQLNKLVASHSKEVVVGPGDLVMWSNYGDIHHQALPAKATPYDPNIVTRMVLAHLFEKKSTAAI